MTRRGSDAPIGEESCPEQGRRQSALLQVVSLARAESRIAYDAAYLELGMRKGLPLATKDQAPVRAAKHCGVAILPS